MEFYYTLLHLYDKHFIMSTFLAVKLLFFLIIFDNFCLLRILGLILIYNVILSGYRLCIVR